MPARHAAAARRHSETHRTDRVGWLRAAVLGANDGILSTAGLMIGVANAHPVLGEVLVAGVAGLVAGALSMAAGEYVSVSSQADSEDAARELEKRELAEDAHGERNELVGIYMGRGLDRPLAEQVADRLMEHDALGAHLRDELGLTDEQRPRPLQAALASAVSFAVGALLPLVAALVASPQHLSLIVAIASLVSLTVLGAVAARTGGAGILKGALRVLFWGALAMALAAFVGSRFGVST
jgi:VIT1/CCC1 family predicted Fe2+/Mn2+ transporter